MKSSGVEWIGEIPVDWKVQRLKAVLCERNESNNPIKTDYILSLTNDRGVIPYAEKGEVGNKSKDDLTGYKLAYEGDIVLNSMNVIIGSVALSKYYGCVSPVYYMLFLRNKNNDIRYYNYLFQTKELQSKLKGYGNGIMEIRMRIQMSKLNTLILPVAPSTTQQKIANYLDVKCAKIDGIIQRQRAVIEKLKEYKSSVITEAVTKGLTPGTPMKPSGIKWIGEIPIDWELVQTKRFFRNNKRVIGNAVDDYERLALTLNGVIKRDKNDSEGLQPEKFEGYQILRENELVFKLIDLENVRTSRVGLSPYTGIVSPAYIVLSNNSKDNRFFYYWFMFMYYNEVFNHLGGDGVRSALSAKDLLSIFVPAIDSTTQQKIANYLDAKCTKIDAIISSKQSLIDKLTEYKKSLIYEVVTGKKEV